MRKVTRDCLKCQQRMRCRYCSMLMNVYSLHRLERWTSEWWLRSTMGLKPLGLHQLWWKTESMSSHIYWQNKSGNSQHILLCFCEVEPRNGLVDGKLKHKMLPYFIRIGKKWIFWTSICIICKLFLKLNRNTKSLIKPLDSTNVS